MKKLKVTPKDKLSEIVKAVEPGTEIFLSEGTYREKIEITVPSLQLTGEGPEKTVIQWDDYAKKPDDHGVELNTFRTYTAAVLADNVTMKTLAVVNVSKKPEEKGQEVALTVYGNNFLAEGCNFVSTQDTVFCGPLPPDLIERYKEFLKDELRKGDYLRQIFKNCRIAGNVDFIFGCGDALFENCEICSVFDVRGHGYVAAPAHSLSQEIGFVFSQCQFTSEEEVAKNSIFLARPWRDYGKASFIDCRYGEHISKEGFDKWNDTDRDKTARFSEWGADREGRVQWSKALSDDDKNSLLNYFK